jgi:predicted transcriptional regulator
MLNNELLSLLLRYYGDHELGMPVGTEGVDELIKHGLIERTSGTYCRITKPGFQLASAAICAANRVVT